MPLEYSKLLILLTFAVVFAFILINLAVFLGPFRPNKKKNMVYESGMDPVGTARDRFSVKFYLTAMLFILFDIEIVFMYPWAVNYKSLGLFGFIEMLAFVIILFVGYIYMVKKGGLEWETSVKPKKKSV